MKKSYSVLREKNSLTKMTTNTQKQKLIPMPPTSVTVMLGVASGALVHYVCLIQRLWMALTPKLSAVTCAVSGVFALSVFAALMILRIRNVYAQAPKCNNSASGITKKEQMRQIVWFWFVLWVAVASGYALDVAFAYCVLNLIDSEGFVQVIASDVAFFFKDWLDTVGVGFLVLGFLTACALKHLDDAEEVEADKNDTDEDAQSLLENQADDQDEDDKPSEKEGNRFPTLLRVCGTMSGLFAATICLVIKSAPAGLPVESITSIKKFAAICLMIYFAVSVSVCFSKKVQKDGVLSRRAAAFNYVHGFFFGMLHASIFAYFTIPKTAEARNLWDEMVLSTCCVLMLFPVLNYFGSGIENQKNASLKNKPRLFAASFVRMMTGSTVNVLGAAFFYFLATRPSATPLADSDVRALVSWQVLFIMMGLTQLFESWYKTSWKSLKAMKGINIFRNVLWTVFLNVSFKIAAVFLIISRYESIPESALKF
ncbi:hypothetical protein HK100_000849 [Physocladia obscura]|uniref:Uncharacterized protein n=1 Tax=Physocladia obscura TaxID=109957 RepID=A0AAD5XEY6_9FUNG|nr:hypothetical protein HK100_000849 [Physocladia obscura]